MNVRVDTFPFISSDSYALRCDVVIDRQQGLRGIEEFLKNIEDSSSIYLAGRSLPNFIEYNAVYLRKFRKIVIGDDDQTQDGLELRVLERYAEDIYSVNLINPSGHIKPLPLGLESPSYRSGGRLKDFKTKPNQSVKKRPIDFLVAWNSSTNLSSRREALSVFKDSNRAFVVQKRIAPQTFHRLLRRSLFVPCPAGNGMDTHRIWEAIYLGAIPVILKRESFAALQDWPVLIINSWEELFTNTRAELESMYDEQRWTYSSIISKSQSILSEIQS